MHAARTRLFIVLSLAGMSSRVAADPIVGISPTPPSVGVQIKTDHGYMVPYKATIAGSDATFEMLPIPGGRFVLGSRPDEKGRSEDEGPQVEIEIPPFWMSKFEVTWAEYRYFMKMNDIFKSFETKSIRVVIPDRIADAVTAPSNLYDPSFTFTKGDNPKLPAVTMSQHATKQYTKWLSKLTGQAYRLEILQ